MPTPDHTHHDLPRLRLALAVSAVALVAVTVWMWVSDCRREWKRFQPPGGRIEEIRLPELTIDYHSCGVGRTDRCVTCHGNVAVQLDDALWLHPPNPHPRLDLFVGDESPHPMGEYGCTVCHEGQGSATAFCFASHTPDNSWQRARWRDQFGWSHDGDWEYRMLARRFFESRCLACHFDVTDLEPSRRFPDPPAPKLVAGYHLVRQYGCFGCHEIRGVLASGERVGPDMRLEQGSAAGPPGAMRKVGPNLRDVASRLDRRFLASWIGNPADFRPDSRMPRLFGLTDQLDEESKAKAERWEAVERAGVAEWLLAVGRGGTGVSPVALPHGQDARGALLPPSAERGRRLLLAEGCLACHRHDDYPESTGVQGPNLSRLGAKYTSTEAAAWLTEWLRDPARYSPRTAMPRSELELVALPRANGQTGAPEMSDPVADLVAYLLASKDWAPDESPAVSEEDVNELVLAHLAVRYSPEEAKRILGEGLSDREAGAAIGDELELVGPASREKKLRYVGRRTVAKRGCFGCHDIPGFESAAPIGPALSDWGRKDESLLAFGDVARRVAPEGTAEKPSDIQFFGDAVWAGRREGFLWQKLRAPRSFDYGQTAGRGFNQWLRMGRFNFDASQREAVATFVLGLVAESPAERYVPHPDAVRRAIVEGRKVLDRHACAECHMIETDRWRIAYDAARFEPPLETACFDFMSPAVRPEDIQASKRTDRRGRAHAEIEGTPRLDDAGRLAVFEGDEEDARGEPLPMRAFTLWRPAALAGGVWPVGGPDVLVYDREIHKKYAAWGGAAARLLYPAALADARVAGMSVVGNQAWGRLPPPLVGEGVKVRPEWLAAHLANPQSIRPAALFRMPKFILSDDEVVTLVDFFEAQSGMTRSWGATGVSPVVLLHGQDARGTQDGRGTRDVAMRFLTDRKTFCAKCHVIGDYRPGETASTIAPDLASVGRRLRPEYLRRWLADPRAILPYTPMPVNFPPSGEPLGQDLLPGTSVEQIDAVVDLLENYDEHLRTKTPIREMMEKPRD